MKLSSKIKSIFKTEKDVYLFIFITIPGCTISFYLILALMVIRLTNSNMFDINSYNIVETIKEAKEARKARRIKEARDRYEHNRIINEMNKPINFPRCIEGYQCSDDIEFWNKQYELW